jgi:hypothetical protein
MLEAIRGDTAEADFITLDEFFVIFCAGCAPGLVAWQSQQSSLTLA